MGRLPNFELSAVVFDGNCQLARRFHICRACKSSAEDVRAYIDLAASRPGLLGESHKVGVVVEQLGLFGEE